MLRSRFRPAWLCGATLAFAVCAGLAQAQTTAAKAPRPLVLNQTQYRVRAGEFVEIDADADTVEFVANAKSRNVATSGATTPGFVFGPNETGDRIRLAASLALNAGEYQVNISASGEAGDERAAALDVMIEPMQAVPVTASQPPVILLSGWQQSCPVAVTSPPSASTFGYLEQYLASYDSVPAVYWFDNCAVCPSCSVEQLSAYLGQVISTIQYTNGAPAI